MFANLVKDARATSLVRLLDSSSILGRSVAAPKGTPTERVRILREAFAAAVNDPEFLADMDKRKLPVEFRSAEQLQAYVKDTIDTPSETVKTFLELVAGK